MLFGIQRNAVACLERQGNVSATNDTQIVEHLRRRHPASRPRRVDVRLIKAGKVKRWNVRPDGISFTLSKKKTESPETSSEFIHHSRGDHPAVSDCKV